MQPEADNEAQAGDPGWKRFNDEIFSLPAGASTAIDPLVSQLASEGIELVVDARRDNAKTDAMEANCEGAGVYYVPAPDSAPGRGLSTEAATRYAKLAMRHKTCFLVDDDDDELLSLISEQIPFSAVPLGRPANPGDV